MTPVGFRLFAKNIGILNDHQHNHAGNLFANGGLCVWIDSGVIG